MNQPQTFWLENLQKADRYNHWIFEQIKPHLGNHILEIGCGNGNFTIFLAQHCDRIMAIDINQEYLDLANQRLQNQTNVTVKNIDVNQLASNNTFDTIVMLDVLEHLKNDVAILAKLNTLLQPGGKLIIKVPALNCIYGEMDRVIGHYRRYNKKTLINTFKQAQLSEPKLWYFNLAGVPGWWLNSKILKRTIPPSQQVSLFNMLVPFLSMAESYFKLNFGLSLFAVATKSSIDHK